MPVEKLKNFLDSNSIKYALITHSPAYTAQEVAESAHISGNKMAKTVILKVGDKFTMIVLPASHHVDLQQLKELMNAENVEFAIESEFKDHFPECDKGAIPPFGNLFNMDVYISDCLSHEKKMTFSAGNYSELICLNYKDYCDLVQPKALHLC